VPPKRSVVGEYLQRRAGGGADVERFTSATTKERVALGHRHNSRDGRAPQRGTVVVRAADVVEQATRDKQAGPRRGLGVEVQPSLRRSVRVVVVRVGCGVDLRLARRRGSVRAAEQRDGARRYLRPLPPRQRLQRLSELVNEPDPLFLAAAAREAAADEHDELAALDLLLERPERIFVRLAARNGGADVGELFPGLHGAQ